MKAIGGHTALPLPDQTQRCEYQTEGITWGPVRSRTPYNAPQFIGLMVHACSAMTVGV
jgi:hypothetical protein